MRAENADVLIGDVDTYWAAAADGRLVLPRCEPCDLFIWYPRGFCPRCLSPDVRWVEVSGRGNLYSTTRVERGGVRADGASYVVAYVELFEGPRILAEVRGDQASAKIDAHVHAAFDVSSDATPVLHFVLDPSP